MTDGKKQEEMCEIIKKQTGSSYHLAFSNTEFCIYQQKSYFEHPGEDISPNIDNGCVLVVFISTNKDTFLHFNSFVQWLGFPVLSTV